MATTVPGFPNQAQLLYAKIPKTMLPGDVWEGELFDERQTGGLLAAVTPVPGEYTITIGAFNATDQVGVTINGGTVAVEATTDANFTAGLLATALENAGFLVGVLADVTLAAPAVTIVGESNVALTVVEYSPDATTATVVEDTAPVSQQEVCFGYGVARDIPSPGAHRYKIRRPSALADQFAGVLVRTKGGQIPADQILNFDSTLNTDFLLPGNTYNTAKQNMGVVVEFVGTAPAETDDVYWVKTGVNAGKWDVIDGAVSQVTQGDVEFNGVEVVGLAVDALPDLTVASNTSDDQTAEDLRDAWNGSAQHAAVAAATIDTSGAESLIILSFVDDQVHTVVAVSPATADIVAIVNTTTAVAANASLMPNFSWGAPSILAANDAPARAFLRLSNP